MPVILVNNANSIEVDISAALKYTITKGDFDVILESTGVGIDKVQIVLRSHAITERYISLDWRDISPPPTINSAEELRDLLLSWNVPAVPDGAATADNQTNGDQKAQVKLIDTNGNPQEILMENNCPTVRDYYVGIGEGDVATHSMFRLLAAATMGTAGGEVWGPASAYVFPAVAAGMRVVSSSGNDAANGTGVRTIRIYYLDGNYVEKTTDVILNGTNPVNTTATDIFRVNRVRTLTAGSGEVAAGDINVYNLSTATIYSTIQTGLTISRTGVFTVPAGKTLFITDFSAGSLKTSSGTATTFTVRATYDDITGQMLTAGLLFVPIIEFGVQDGTTEKLFNIPIRVPEKTDIKISAMPLQVSTLLTAAIRGWTETN